MPETDKIPTIPETLRGARFVEAGEAQVEATADTTSSVMHARMVATSRTTGSLSIRYVPRTPTNGSGVDTTH